MKKNLSLAVLTVASATSLWACDLCAVYSAHESRGELGRGFSAGVAEQFTHFGTMQQDGQKVPNDAHQHLKEMSAKGIVFENGGGWRPTARAKMDLLATAAARFLVFMGSVCFVYMSFLCAASF